MRLVDATSGSGASATTRATAWSPRQGRDLAELDLKPLGPWPRAKLLVEEGGAGSPTGRKSDDLLGHGAGDERPPHDAALRAAPR